MDKFDYILRDCHNLGLKSSYDSSRLMNFSRVIDGIICFLIFLDQICYSKSVVQDVYQLFHTRMNNFKTVYLHKTSKAIEYMIVDMLLAGTSLSLITYK